MPWDNACLSSNFSSRASLSLVTSLREAAVVLVYWMNFLGSMLKLLGGRRAWSMSSGVGFDSNGGKCAFFARPAEIAPPRFRELGMLPVISYASSYYKSVSFGPPSMFRIILKCPRFRRHFHLRRENQKWDRYPINIFWNILSNLKVPRNWNLQIRLMTWR